MLVAAVCAVCERGGSCVLVQSWPFTFSAWIADGLQVSGDTGELGLVSVELWKLCSLCSGCCSCSQQNATLPTCAP